MNLDSVRLSHAYITSGELAETLALAAVCSGSADNAPCMLCPDCDKAMRHIHPDVTIVTKLPEKREILVDQIRELRKDAIVVPIESKRKVYIIKDAELMNTAAQNAFLQILEEPPPGVVFILITEKPASLLETVFSRCVSLHDKPSPDKPAPVDFGAAPEEMAEAFLKALEGGNLPLTAFMFKLEKLDKNSFGGFLNAARAGLVSRLKDPGPAGIGIPRESLAQAVRVLVKAGEMFELNVNAGHISGMICASLMSVDI